MREKILSFFSFISDTIWDLMPSTPIAYLIYLLIIVIFSLFLIFYFSRKKPKNIKTEEKPKEITINHLLKIANNPKSTLKDLVGALVMYNEKFKVENDVKKSIELFEKILNHKNRNKAVFDYFHGNILPKNLKFKDELNKLEQEALNK